MKMVELLKIGRELLKLMSACDLKRDDYLYIDLYEEYAKMRNNGEKVEYIISTLSLKYKLSESTIKRIIKRISQEVK